MFAGQVNWTGPSSAAGQRVARDSSANGDDSKAAFALVYEAILRLSEEPCSETDTSDNWLDTDAQGVLLGRNDSSGQRAAITMGASAGELNLGAVGLQYSGSSMGRLMSQDREAQVVPVPLHGAELPATSVDMCARQNEDSGQPFGPDGNVAPPSNSAGVLNKSKLTAWMDAHALSRSSHHCAMYVRLGMEAAGLNTGDRPRSGDAGDYGPFLLRHGAQKVPPDSYAPQVGDVVVFDKTVQHPFGHIEMYDGQQWVSDFMQNSFSPYRDAISTPPFTVYRLG